MTMLHAVQAPASAERPHVRRIHPGELDWALAAGWKDFREKRGEVVMLALIYPAVGMLAAALTLNSRLLPMFFPIAAGVSILGPAVASGFYVLASRREAGLESGWRHFVDPLLGGNRLALAALTAGLLALFLAWLLCAWAIYAATLGPEHLRGADFLRALFTTSKGWTLIALGNLVGLGFAVATLALGVVSFPMVVDKGVDAFTAVSTSIRAVSANPKAMTLWGLRVAGLLLLGALPAFVGLAIVLPTLGYATWRLYTRLVER
jgi:uncharacterized membrane protein